MRHAFRKTTTATVLLLTTGCGGGGSGGGSGPPGSGSAPPRATAQTQPAAPTARGGNVFAQDPEFCAMPQAGGACRSWAPAAVRADAAYQRIADRFPGERPGQGVKVTVVDTGIAIDSGRGVFPHWEFDLSRTTEEVVSGEGDLNPGIGDPSHGTAVASVLVARKGPDAREEVPSYAKDRTDVTDADFHGIAYGARLHMLAIRLGSADPNEPFEPITAGQLGDADAGNASLWRRALASQGGPDVINASFGYNGLARKYDAQTLRRNMGGTIAAWAQESRPPAERTLIVSSAGNSNRRICERATPGVGSECVGETRTHYGRIEADSPSVNAALMAHIPELRPHTVAVVSIGRDGQISRFSNRCGIAAAWCIAAPGEDMLVATKTFLGLGYTTIGGTSFAAPVVSGGLALVMHHFRGQLGNTEVLARVLGTADVVPDQVAGGSRCPAHLDTDGDLSDCELSSTVGRGLMNLDRATRPVGEVVTGTPAHSTSLAATRLHTPSAWGDVGARLGSVEIASFDEWNAPFWSALGSTMAPSESGPATMRLVSEGTGAALPSWRGLAWTKEGANALPGLSLAYSADTQGVLSAAGLSYAATPGLRAGLVFEQGSMLGGSGEGAFEGDSVHGLVFGTLTKGWTIREDLRLRASATLAGGGLGGGHGMLREARGLYSAGRVDLERGDEEALTRLTVEQPLRAESGSAHFVRPVGRSRSGEWLYGTAKVGLAPDARAVSLGLAHERKIGGGTRLGLGWRYTHDAGHVRGRDETWVGARLGVEF